MSNSGANKIVEDVKTGLKGIRGAGDALRGSVMDATDQAFDNQQNHPETQAAKLKNETIAEKGKREMQGVDDRLSEHEQKKEARRLHETGLASNGAGAARGVGHHPLPLN
ncbi:hypothetical protein F5B22DRAFT_595896 [Xylaria bambusicola]|uniref:uncharacterized protein n=1 Tax=Xylaria bambusicola TaxID=326684 RepID=UPI0020084962|nr:uncharacterized protein F5B22DRAFT_595896 [Xylaria bambusicola]KAI0521694.1 hypothetical protein F5B22DRAFT_595896 [Xylaria bambusicola]